MKQEITISGLWLRRKQSGDIQVLIEREGKWTLVLNEYGESISHIVEASGMLNGKPDPIDAPCPHGWAQDIACDECGRSGFRWQGVND